MAHVKTPGSVVHGAPLGEEPSTSGMSGDDVTRRSIWDASLGEHLMRTVVICTTLYLLFALALTYEPFQRSVLYLHNVNWPPFPKYDAPERYGFAPNRVRNFYIETPDGARLGAWHVLPQSISNQHDLTANLSEAVFEDALRSSNHVTMLYFHGNAASRLTGHRVHLARYMSSGDMDLNFVIIDYRGFGDSTGPPPSEAGLLTDARAAWDWLTLNRGVPSSQIVVSGQSLGTAVATALVRHLQSEDIVPRALFLVAPFSSLRKLLTTYKLLQYIPVLQPLNYVPRLRTFALSFLRAEFNTIESIKDDGDIVHTHSREIFAQLQETEAAGTGGEEGDVAIHTRTVTDYATIRSFQRTGLEGAPRVVHLEAKYGGHNQVGLSETTLRVMKEVIANGDGA